MSEVNNYTEICTSSRILIPNEEFKNSIDIFFYLLSESHTNVALQHISRQFWMLRDRRVGLPRDELCSIHATMLRSLIFANS